LQSGDEGGEGEEVLADGVVQLLAELFALLEEQVAGGGVAGVDGEVELGGEVCEGVAEIVVRREVGAEMDQFGPDLVQEVVGGCGIAGGLVDVGDR
jgi:hypothetical protein